MEVSVEGPIGRLRLTRESKRNALDRETLEGIAAAAADFDRRPEVKVVIVSGEGSSFCAGFDLTDPSWTSDGQAFERSAATGRAMAEALDSMTAITIASIRGHCIGGGVVLAAACDLRVASTTTRFRIPEADLGVPLYWTGVPRLVRELGPALTKELILTTRAFDADEARAIRFVNRVVDDADLEAATLELAREVAARPALVLRVTKEQVDRAAPPIEPDDPGVELDVAGFAAALADPECREVAATYAPRGRGRSAPGE